MNNILTDRELQVVSLRFGLLDANGMFTKLGNIGRSWMLGEIAQLPEFNCTRERISHLEIKALRKLTLTKQSEAFEKPLTTTDILFLCKQIQHAKLEVDILMMRQTRFDLEQEYKEKVRRIHQSEIDTQNRINSAKEGIGE